MRLSTGEVTGKYFLAMLAVTLILSLNDALFVAPQGASQSTSTSYVYTTERYTTVVLVSQTHRTGDLFYMEMGLARFAGTNRFSLDMNVKNLMNERISDVRIGVGFKFDNGTYTKEYVRSIGDFDPGESKNFVFSVEVDFNLATAWSHIEYWYFGYISGSMTKLTVRTRTLTYTTVFAYTSTESPRARADYTFNVGLVEIAAVAGILVIVLLVVVLRRRGHEPPVLAQPTGKGEAVSEHAQKYCINCGRLIDADAERCTECGAVQS